ncbi:MAG: DUF2141 domain-containing protein [Bacteroidales bacterium]
MKQTLISISKILIGMFLIVFYSSSKEPDKSTGFSLTVEVNDLRNSNGTVLFALYNRQDAFPDENYQKYNRKLTGKISKGYSHVTFENLPAGKYAVNILHDENNDGKIKKGIVLPKEGIGFSNYQSIGITNQPTFTKASFILQSDMKIQVHIIYL